MTDGDKVLSSYCDEHKSHAKSIKQLEEGQLRNEAKLDGLAIKIARWGGIAAAGPAILLFLKILEYLVPAARAATEVTP